ncbi:MAG: ATP-binding protein [Cyanobacteriota bacterium]
MNRLAPAAEALLVDAEAWALARVETLSGSQVSPALPTLPWCGPARDPALARVATAFALGEGEVALLALLYAQALSEQVRRALAALDPGLVPLWLARRLIPGLGLDALAAPAPLCRFGLVETEGPGRVEARLSMAPALLDRLCGLRPAIPELEARLRPLRTAASAPALTTQLQALLSIRDDGLPPLVLAGTAFTALELAAGLAGLGLGAQLLRAADLPETPESRARLARLWSREAALDGQSLVLRAEPGQETSVASFAELVWGPVAILGSIGPAAVTRAAVVLAPGLAPADPLLPWRAAFAPLDDRVSPATLRRLEAQFRLDHEEIAALAAVAATALTGLEPEEARARLWQLAGRAHMAPPLAGCRLRDPIHDWTDLVVPPALAAALHRIETHVRHATLVFDDWGFGRNPNGRGVAALFAGPPGTGKSLAAEVLARALGLRMLVIDLSQVISKYIGETAKNIAAAFDLAERTGAVMVWNEGDAIWGSRGQVASATDRHVNAETGDLLSRIEEFRGFTVVTTNLRHAIDPAFLRRFRFVLDFPLPAQDERLALWRAAFPPRVPLEPLNLQALARLPLSGGAIRNVALGAAFQAAEAGGPVAEAMIEAEVAEELRKEGLPAPLIDWRAP